MSDTDRAEVNATTPANPPVPDHLCRLFRDTWWRTMNEDPRANGEIADQAALAAILDSVADSLEDRADVLRGGPFRSGDIGIEFIHGVEDAVYLIRHRGLK